MHLDREKEGQMILISEKTDTQLLNEIVNKDHEAFSELMVRYKGPLYRFILRYIGSPSEAEDLLQDTFTKIYLKASKYDPEWKVSTWVYRIALNTCRDYGRKQKLRRFVSIDINSDDDESTQYISELVDLGPNVEHIVIHRQNFRRVAEAIEKLPHKMRSALVLYSIEGRSQIECSELLGISQKGVEMLVYRARNKLRKMTDMEI
ncbi:MAG: hypothetical protein COC03_00855 [Robiginitomaculum sp.]|nr:MAG: hypothetical protein COC03_00855 [Robiginitomaculum sp.]